MNTLSFHELDSGAPVLVMSDRGESDLHRHTFFELVYVTGGEAEEFFEDGSTQHLSRGDCFLVDLGHAHGYRHCAGAEGFTLINCLFLPALIDPSLAGAESFAEVMTLFLSRYHSDIAPRSGQLLYHDKSGFLGGLFERIRREFERKEAGYTDIIRHLLLTVVITLIRDEIRHAQRPLTPTRRVMRFVEEHYNERLTLGAVSKRLGFSLSYLSALFKKECGQTFRTYLAEVRMRRAAALLSATDMTVEAVARLVGYDDPAFFYKQFQRFFGATPSSYRKSSVKNAEI